MTETSESGMLPEIADKKWHLDRRVPIALILTLLFYGGVGVWWAAVQDQENKYQNQRLTVLETRNVEDARRQSETNERLAKLEARMDAAIEVLRDIRDSLKEPRRK